RIGGTRDIKVDVRVISATNKNLKEDAATGGFRQDLYYRLNVIPLPVPPLRERRDDIPILIEHFLEKHGKKGKIFSKEALEGMEHYNWPGNVRELENAVERLLTFSDNNVITFQDLPLEIRQSTGTDTFLETGKPLELSPEGVNLDKILENIEKSYLAKALEITKGLKTEAAKLLNISFRQFRHRLKKYNIE
ncbi:MAG: sigma-54-dependent Fis family transcriptional regulator, partial [Nitrospirae bacterium]|nr:sigma-54-dependent Fis family transcriptional regulator [Nitrospirota bacterium]